MASAPGATAVAGAVREELRQQFRPPFEFLQVVVFNVALVLGCWFLLGPASISRASSLIFLPAVMASWAFADVPTTNLYGARPEAALAVLDDEAALRRFILVRNLTLWWIVSPVTALLAVYLAWDLDTRATGIMVVATVLGLPMGFFGVAAIMAPLLPYHPMKMRLRWQRRDTWVRWAVAVVIPYCLIGPVALVLLAPGYLVYHALGESPVGLFLSVLTVLVLTWVLRRITMDYAITLTVRRRGWLRGYLSDPNRG